VARPEPDFAALLRFRTELRRFNRWSEAQAATVGLTHTQHQLLLAVKGHDNPRGPTISDVADYLLVRHHSVVELVGRVESFGFLERRPDADDGRLVRLKLTRSGEKRIRLLTELHVSELRTLAPLLRGLVDDHDPNRDPGLNQN
jgi:DNA-binding MarR family transcriptional regulator